MNIKDIKFKAKRIDGKGWVFGYFYEENDNAYIIENRQKESKLNRNITYSVEPTTVCQFTGLKDSDGKDIWEGDIVERVIYDPFNGSAKVKALIEYLDGAFVAITDGIPYSLYFKYIKVVGNKFDKEK